MYLKVVAEEGDEEEREEKKVISGRRPFLWSCNHSLFPSSPYMWKMKQNQLDRHLRTLDDAGSNHHD